MAGPGSEASTRRTGAVASTVQAVVAAETVVPVVVLYGMVVVGCVPTMGVAMAAVGGLLAVAMAFVFRFDFPIFYTVEAPVVIVGCR